MQKHRRCPSVLVLTYDLVFGCDLPDDGHKQHQNEGIHNGKDWCMTWTDIEK